MTGSPVRPRVLLATDGSPGSVAAARAAVALAGPDATYLLVRAESFTPVVSPTGMLGAGAALAPIYEEQRGVAATELASTAAALDVEVEQVLVEGPAVSAILRVAEDREVDLVVVGARGLGAVKRALLGSVSSALVHESDRPVLVVPS